MRFRFYQLTRSLSTRLLLAFILLVLLTAGTTSLVGLVSYFRSQTVEVEDDLHAIVQHKDTWLRARLNTIRTAFELTASHSDIVGCVRILSSTTPRRDYADCASHVDDDLNELMNAQSDLLDEVSLIDVQGRIVASSNASQYGRSVAENRYFQEGLKQGYLQPPIYSPSAGRVLMFFAYPVKNQEQTAAVLAGSVRKEALNEIMAETAGLGKDGAVFLIGSDYTLLTPSLQTAPGTQLAETARLFKIPRAGEPGSPLVDHSLPYDNAQGTPVIGIYHYIPELQAGLIAEETQAQAFGSAIYTLQIDVAITAAIVLAAGILALFVIRSITAPLSALASAAGEIERGNLQLKLTVPEEIEIGSVARAFNRMAARLHEVITSLQRHVQLLENSEERFRSVAQMANEVIITADVQGRIAFWNKAAEDTFGYTASEAIGHELTLIMPERFVERHREALARTVVGSGPSQITRNIELAARRKDATEIPVELSLSAWATREGTFFTSIIRDIGKRKWAQSIMDAYVRNLQLLSNSAMRFLSKMSYQEVLDYVAEQLSVLADNCLVLVSQYQPDENCMVVAAVAGDQAKLQALGQIAGHEPVGLGFMPLTETWQKMPDSRFMQVDEGIHALSIGELPFGDCKRIENELGLNAAFVMPLALNQDLLGAVTLLTQAATLPSQITVIETFVRQAAIALYNRRAEEQLRRARAELEQRVEERTQELAQANLELRTEMVERWRAEERIEGLYRAEQEARRIAETLRAASLSLTKSLELDTVLDALLENLSQLVTCDRAHVLLPETEARFVLRATCTANANTMPLSSGQITVDAHSAPVLERFVAAPESVLIADTWHQQDWRGLPPELDGRSWLAVPLNAGGNLIGLCVLTREEPNCFSAEQLQLVQALAAQTGIAIQNAWLFEQVRAGREHLQGLSRRLVEFQESERLYISRELHDETGQLLTGLKVGLRLLERDADSHAAVVQHVTELRRLVDEVLENLRRLAMHFRPATLDQLGLIAALHDYVQDVGQRHSLQIELETVGFTGGRLPSAIETMLYRVIQEGLTNIVRHAQATRVQIILERSPHLVKATIDDDGVGFDTVEAMHKGRLGLLGMEERVQTLGGKFTIMSDPGEGSTLIIEVPYDDSDSNSG